MLQIVSINAEFTPHHVSCDTLGKDISEMSLTYLCKHNVEFQSCTSHKAIFFVYTLRTGIWPLLLQSYLPLELWECAVHYVTDIYNHIPHALCDNAISYSVHHKCTQDV